MTHSRLSWLSLCLLLAGCGTLDRAPIWPEPQTSPEFTQTPAESEEIHESSSPDSQAVFASSRRTSGPRVDQSVKPVAFNQPPEEIPQPPPDTDQQPTSELPSVWTLETLEQVAMANNPSLGEAAARVQAAQGHWLQAGLPPNVVSGYSGQQIGSKGLAEQEGIYLGQEFVVLRKLRYARNVAAQEIQVAQQQFEAQQRRVLTDVRMGYYEVLVAQRRLELTGQLLDINQSAVKAAQDLFDIKEVGVADVLRATVELQATQLLLKTSQNKYNAAWGRLSAVLGLPQLQPQRLEGELTADLVHVTQEDALFRLIQQSPELQAAVAQVERERWALQRARVEPLPNLEVQGLVQSDNSTHSSNGALQATFSLPIWNRNQGGIRAAEAQIVEAERAVNRVELSLERRLATVYQEYASARNTVEAYSAEEGILDNVRKTLEAVRANYSAGELSYIDLLTAQRTYAQTNLAYIEALGQLRAALAEIDGLLLKDSLSSGR